ncbi:uncharacterized protein LOC142463149 isoform X2 [Ascaphus truei]|uniref:uncharacterized protein LOC142463149 isoform X2 n=1 Tax=Ascaphus truei TaxID=8439 RepID=UPI003F5A50F9
MTIFALFAGADLLVYFITGILFLIYLLNGSKKSAVKLPPGPRPLPLIGNLNLVNLKKPFQSLMECADPLRSTGLSNELLAPVAPRLHVSPHTEKIASPASSSSSSTMEEPDVDNEGNIQLSQHEHVPTRPVTQQSTAPARDTYSAIAASEERIVVEENRRHSDMMSVLERMISQQERMISQQDKMISQQERTISQQDNMISQLETSIAQMSQLERIFIQVPKQIQNVNRTLQAIVQNLSQANQLRMTAREQLFHFTPSEDGSLHGENFSPQSSVLHSPVLDDTGTVAASSVQVPVNMEPLTSGQNQQPTPTTETRKRNLGKQLLITSFWSKFKKPKQETAPPSVVQCVSTPSPLPQPTPSGPELSQPTTSGHELAQPKTSGPELAQPTTSGPELAQPTTSGPELAQPTTSGPELAQPTTSGPELAQPTTSGPELAQPTTSGPELAQPTTSGPELAQPTPSGPELAQPTTSGPELAQPTTSGPELAQPTTSGPELAQPTTSGPELAQPTTSGPELAQPTTSGPELAQPTTSGPELAQPTTVALNWHRRVQVIQ